MDLLSFLFLKYPYTPEKLKKMVCGEKNVAIMLDNGSIGVCSTLCNTVECAFKILENPDFTNYHHRIIINAWVNAFANNSVTPSGTNDIFDAIDFTRFEHVVMVGYFGSLSKKLMDIGINLSVFDLNEEDKPVEPLKNLASGIQKADAVILTATSISNNTFNELVGIVSTNSKVFILGPSTPLSTFMFSNPVISGLFGARFEPFDHEVLQAIEQGGGTRSFLGRMQKIYILR
jgi:uncharacterized protein (DUF4213/DUF364 family)